MARLVFTPLVMVCVGADLPALILNLPSTPPTCPYPNRPGLVCWPWAVASSSGSFANRGPFEGLPQAETLSTSLTKQRACLIANRPVIQTSHGVAAGLFVEE